jgi:hypothetical protein
VFSSPKNSNSYASQAAILSTNRLTIGMTTKEIGTPKAELTAKPRIQSSQNSGLIPVLTMVIMNVSINDMTTDVNVANKSSRYLSDTFKPDQPNH